MEIRGLRAREDGGELSSEAVSSTQVELCVLPGIIRRRRVADPEVGEESKSVQLRESQRSSREREDRPESEVVCKAGVRVLVTTGPPRAGGPSLAGGAASPGDR